MRKGLLSMLALAVAMLLATSQVLAIDIYCRNMQVETDTEPVIQNGRTMVPLRVISETLDASVEWNQKTKEVTIEKDEIKIVLTVGKPEVLITEKGKTRKETMDVAPSLINQRTMVPVAFISKVLGSKVEWHNMSRSVLVDSDIYKLDLDRMQMSSAQAAQLIFDAVKGNPAIARELKGAWQLIRTDMSLTEQEYMGLVELRERFPGEYQFFTCLRARTPNPYQFAVNTRTKDVFFLDSAGIFKYPEEEPVVFFHYGEYGFGYVDPEIYVIEILKKKGILDRAKTYRGQAFDLHSQNDDSWRAMVTISEVSGNTSKVVGSYYMESNLSVLDEKMQTIYVDPLSKSKPALRLTEANAGKEALRIASELGALGRDPADYTVTAVKKTDAELEAEEMYTDIVEGYLVRAVYNKAPAGPDGEQVVDQFFIQSDGNKMAQLDPELESLITIYGIFTPVG